jgi:hypothetical protein
MKTSSQIVQNVTSHITGRELLNMLSIPANATNIQITVQVPGGGDWSNTSLDLLEEYITVRYQLQD